MNNSTKATTGRVNDKQTPHYDHGYDTIRDRPPPSFGSAGSRIADRDRGYGIWL
jgi:hypothetical protein